VTLRHEHGDHKRKEIADDMKWMRQRGARLLPGEAGEWGVNQYSGLRNTNSSTTTHTVDGILRRLNRDHPELAEKVAMGELPANKAAIEAGPAPGDRARRAGAAPGGGRPQSHLLTTP
jgi:hypothetical protein